MKILKIEKFEREYPLQRGDTFSLRLDLDGEILYAVDIVDYIGETTITHWACIKIGDNIGYFIGNHTLEEDLRNL